MRVENLKACYYKHRAICNFRIIENSNLNDEEKIKKMFDDFEISLRYNANDYNTFHWLGTVCYYLGYYKEALDYLYRANDLCEDYETAKEIQEQIEKTKDKEFWRNMKDLSITAAPFLLKGAFYAIKLFCGGGGGQDQY